MSSNSQANPNHNVEELQSQIDAFQSEINGLQESLVTANKKRDNGGSLFIAGSGLLLLTIISFPFLSLLISIVLIFLGIFVSYFGRSDSRAIQKKLEEAILHVSRLEEEVQLQKQNG